MLVAILLRLEIRAYICIYKRIKMKNTDLLRICYRIMNVNIMRTKASSKTEGSVSWSVKWPLVLH